jgi:hypothetical protein
MRIRRLTMGCVEFKVWTVSSPLEQPVILLRRIHLSLQ